MKETAFRNTDGPVPQWGGFLTSTKPGSAGATQVLLGVESGVAVPVPNYQVGAHRVQPTLLSLADGRQRPSGDPVVSPGNRPVVLAAGELTRDGVRDYTVYGLQAGSTGVGVVEARDGASGRALWRTGTPVDSGVATDAGDVTGDGVDDLAVSVRKPVGAQFGYELSLLDGATGARRWTAAGYAASPLGDTDGRAGAELLVLDKTEDADEQFVSEGGKSLGLAVRGVAGTARWQGTLADVAQDGDVAFFFPVPDMDGDRAADVYVEYETSGGWGHTFGFADFSRTALFSGRKGAARRFADGRVLLRDFGWAAAYPGPAGSWRGSVDGRGADLARVAVSTDRRSLTLVVWNGGTGRELWRVTLPSGTGPGDTRSWLGGPPVAADLDGDRCADVVLPTTAGGDDVYAFRGKDGALLWATRLGTPADLPLRPRVAHAGHIKTCR